MENIFDNNVVDYLKSLGVSDNEIKRIKFNKLKNYAVNRLVEVVNWMIRTLPK